MKREGEIREPCCISGYGGLRGLAPFLECGTALHTGENCDFAVPLFITIEEMNFDEDDS